MTDAPERLAVHWTMADRETMPSSVGALTPKDSGFLFPPPINSHAERVEYRRDDLPLTLAEALTVRGVQAMVEALTAIAEYRGACGHCGKLAVGPGAGKVGCNDHHNCRWEPIPAAHIASAALARLRAEGIEG